MPTEDCTVTIKGRGPGGAWIVLKGSNATELMDQLAGAFPGVEMMKDLPSMVLACQQSFLAEEAVTLALVHAHEGTGAAPQAAQYSAPPAASGGAWGGPPQGGGMETCPHGYRTLKSGNGARGAWSAWMCPAPQGDPTKCKPVDAKTGKPWR
jgi:hypothetical protein